MKSGKTVSVSLVVKGFDNNLHTMHTEGHFFPTLVTSPLLETIPHTVEAVLFKDDVGRVFHWTAPDPRLTNELLEENRRLKAALEEFTGVK